MSRKKSIDLTDLPDVPEIPTKNESSSSNIKKKFISKCENNDQLATMLKNLKEREISLFENIKSLDEHDNGSDINQAANVSIGNSKNNNNGEEEECRDYILPLMTRTQSTIIQLMQTKESLHQLDSLHRIIEQLLMVQEQNSQMRKQLRTVKTLSALKEMEIQINSDPEKFMKSSGFFDDGSDIENNAEFEQNMQNLEAMLAASKSASNKRSASKKHRSKSIISEENTIAMKENNRNYPLRRQSAISDFKPKVSKWTKVKTWVKWEKTNTLHLSESKSSDSILSPSSSDNYNKNFLKVPSPQATCQSCSGDSLISTSSGKVLTATSCTPEISSAHSSDENDETMSKARPNYIRHPSFYDDERRSHSLDGELSFGGNLLQAEKPNNKNNKSAWSKVKGIVTNRNSRKSMKSNDSVSRDVSPIDINDISSDLVSSANQSPSSPNSFNLTIPDIDLCPTSDENENKKHDDGRSTIMNAKQQRRSLKKNRIIPEIESLPENETFETSKRQLPSPLILKKDPCELDSVDGSNITPTFKKIFHSKNLSISDPNSPLKTYEFFSENEFSSSADNDYSFSFPEPLLPTLKRGSNNSSRSSRQQDEIVKNYHDLQRKIKMEFENKQQEWSKIRPLVVQLNNSVPPYLKEDLSLPSTPKNVIENLMLNEENLSADFKRKLEEWRMKKGHQSNCGGKKQVPDWQAWKTGQIKFENQGLIALPDAKDLPEEFQKKLNEWKQMKAEGRSPPPYTHQASVQEKLKRQFSKTDKSSSSNESSMKRSKTQSDSAEELPPQLKSIKSDNEIVVQTSVGLMKFKGISRSFTRKLYEWEKAKGIEPESDSSTFAFLHPRYQIQVDNHTNHENDNSYMKRALSVDSIKPVSYSNQISNQPSSLSLNDADSMNLKESVDKKTCSENEIYCSRNKLSTTEEELEAVIVEVEDEGLEITPIPSVSASSQIQIPVFKFDFANKELNNTQENFRDTFEDIRELLEELNSNFSSLNDLSTISDETLRLLNDRLKKLCILLSQLKHYKIRSGCTELENAISFSKELFDMVNNFDKSSLMNSQNLQMNFRTMVLKIDECLKIINSVNFQATSSIQNPDDKAIATVKVTPTFICNSIKTDKIDDSAISVMHLKVSSESEMQELSTEDMRSDEKSTKKVARNASSSSKRKIRLRRMGSRQNSKTESDSDEEYAQNPDTQRKIKRKSSRATKKQLESDKSFDSFQGEEEVVYVFKIKPGKTNQVITKTSEIVDTPKCSSESSILISPTENCVELIDASVSDLCQSTFTNPIVKTKRKIFTPFNDDKNDKNSSLCISHEIESSSGSEKNDKEKKLIQEEEITKTEVDNELENISHARTPESNVNEKSDIIKRVDLSPGIRLMIEKYHQNIDQKSTPNSNSSSPIWLSPVSSRRVRKQSTEYQFKISKSNSFQEFIDNENLIEKNENLPKKVNTVECVKEKTLDEIQYRLQTNIATGCIPKIPKMPYIQVEEPSSECIQKSNDLDKPRTPLSERALKIKQAKEAFFRNTISSLKEDEQSKWEYRLSQISVGSTDSNSIENMSCSTGMLPTRDPIVSIFEEENRTSSLPRNVSSTSNTFEFEKESPKHSKFGISSIATKLRKVKLKRSSKEVQKMNTVPILCRQSININVSSEASALSDSNRNIKKQSNNKDK